MDWEEPLYTIGGAVLGYVIKLIEIRGKLVINNHRFEATYYRKDSKEILESFRFHIEFHNTSGRTYRISDFKCTLHFKAGGTYYPTFIGHTLPPSLIIEPKKILTETYEIKFDWDIPCDIGDFIDEEYTFAVITYKQNGKEKSLSIPANDVCLIEKPGRDWIAM